ncbi:MAG TPA: hypothetical protein PKD45_03340 [Flavobacteriales bacterium]|nr:hypothetical protein [Flavobacteriales bacterium]
MEEKDEKEFLALLIEPIRACASYRPKFGQGSGAGISLKEFQALYRSDPFYSWYGLDHPMMYAAHKAAGGMTSIYRQIGIGGERLFRRVLQDSLGLAPEQSTWSYTVKGPRKKEKTLYLDGRIDLAEVADRVKREKVADWIEAASADLGVAKPVRSSLMGTVFEVRQGYKSKDSKRQNADLANASTAYTRAYLPCVVVLSNQIDADIVTRYRHERWVILTGTTAERSPLRSTYAFTEQVLGFDLAGFFQRNSRTLKHEVEQVLHALLDAE